MAAKLFNQTINENDKNNHMKNITHIQDQIYDVLIKID